MLVNNNSTQKHDFLWQIIITEWHQSISYAEINLNHIPKLRYRINVSDSKAKTSNLLRYINGCEVESQTNRLGFSIPTKKSTVLPTKKFIVEINGYGMSEKLKTLRDFVHKITTSGNI